MTQSEYNQSGGGAGVPPSTPPIAEPVDYQAPVGAGVEADKDARMWGMLCHLSALAGFVIPFGSIIGPLIVWQIKKDIPFANDQGKESLNFQITVALAMIVCFALAFVIIGFFLIPVVGIGALVFIIIASIKANSGIAYRYPFAIRFIK